MDVAMSDTLKVIPNKGMGSVGRERVGSSMAIGRMARQTASVCIKDNRKMLNMASGNQASKSNGLKRMK